MFFPSGNPLQIQGDSMNATENRRVAGAPLRRALLATLCLLVSACAQIEVLPDGTRIVTGLVRVTIPSQMPAAERAADSIEVTAFGLSMLSTPVGTGITLGFATDRITAVRNGVRATICSPVPVGIARISFRGNEQ